MRKRSNRLPVLLIFLAAFIFICIACLFIWLKNNNSNKFIKEKQQNLNKITPTTISTKTTNQIIETTKTKTTEEEEIIKTTTIKGKGGLILRKNRESLEGKV
ncbi:hypothetical protein ACQ4LE_002195 [Meloidogyne hapla]